MEELRKLVSPDIPLTLNEYGQAEFCLLPSSQTRECDLLPDTHVVMDTSQTTELDPNFPPQCQRKRQFQAVFTSDCIQYIQYICFQ